MTRRTASLTLPLLCALSLGGLAAPASADPVEGQSIQDLLDGADESEKAPGEVDNEVLGSNCYAMADWASFVTANPHPIDTDWRSHAQAWKAMLTPTATSFTPPQYVSSHQPQSNSGHQLNDYESGLLQTVYADQNGNNVDPGGEWVVSTQLPLEYTIAGIALSMTTWDTPVYIHVDPVSGPGDIVALAIERIAIATAGQPFADECTIVAGHTDNDCLSAIQGWWTVTEVEVVVYTWGSPAVRTRMTGAELYDLLALGNGIVPSRSFVLDWVWSYANQASDYHSRMFALSSAYEPYIDVLGLGCPLGVDPGGDAGH